MWCIIDLVSAELRNTMQIMERAIIHAFPDVTPINRVSQGIAEGNYIARYDYITDTTIPLKIACGKKTLYLVCFNQTLETTEYIERLRMLGKKPCLHAPNFLLGLMAQVRENQMPPPLRRMDIVAAEPEESSVFVDPRRGPCFLYVSRDGGSRRLSLARGRGGWRGPWAFVAEDVTS